MFKSLIEKRFPDVSKAQKLREKVERKEFKKNLRKLYHEIKNSNCSGVHVKLSAEGVKFLQEKGYTVKDTLNIGEYNVYW